MEDYVVPAPDEPATIENILELIKAFTGVTQLDGDGWDDFRAGMLRFATEELRNWHSEGVCTMRDMEPRLWGFYRGYMACNEFAVKRIHGMFARMKARQGKQ